MTGHMSGQRNVKILHCNWKTEEWKWCSEARCSAHKKDQYDHSVLLLHSSRQCQLTTVTINTHKTFIVNFCLACYCTWMTDERCSTWRNNGLVILAVMTNSNQRLNSAAYKYRKIKPQKKKYNEMNMVWSSTIYLNV